jgi:hypothetical protein
MKPNGERFIQMLIQLNHQLYKKYKKYDDIPSQIIITFIPNELTKFDVKFLKN